MSLSVLTLASLILWGIIFLLPWQPWRTRERWSVEESPAITGEQSLDDVTVLIPARNEEYVINRTLSSVLKQGSRIRVVVIDDNSQDNTAGIVSGFRDARLTLIRGKERPDGWSGKLWALEQGLDHVHTSCVMLLDADIELRPGVISGLKLKLEQENRSFVSLMAMPSLTNFWEKLLMPAFIYFFKLLYPFKLSNSSNRLVAAAAGGCILAKKEVFYTIGGFKSLKGALIDDCTLARRVKNQGYSIWIGLTRSARSIRPYNGLKEIWDMVARTAFTQLRHSVLLLLLCTFLMVLAFVIPLIGIIDSIFTQYQQQTIYSFAALLIMFATFIPVLRFYRLSTLLSLFLPLTGILFLGMTWTSAVRYWTGERMRWRGRIVHKM